MNMDMQGFAAYIEAHPKKKFTGFLVSESGRKLSDKEVRIVVSYCKRNGIIHLSDCPDIETIVEENLRKVFGWMR